MDPILEPSRYLIPDWMDRLIEDCKDEARYSESSWPIKLLGMTTRRLVWNLCGKLGVQSKGVPGQVCRLVERYLAARFRSMSVLTRSQEEWDEFTHSLVSRIPLLIASAIQLSGKMSSMAEQVRATSVQKALLMKSISYTIDEIVTSEFEVLKTLNFRVPLWTSVEAAELLATDVGVPPKMLRGVVIIVDLAEFHRFNIEADLIITATGYLETLARSKLRTLHMCAGAVIAATRHLDFQGQDPTLRLAMLTRAPVAYLTCVCDTILRYINDDEVPLATKRRKISLH